MKIMSPLSRILRITASLCVIVASSVYGQTYQTLTTFTGVNGSVPTDALVQGSDGNFYGTTQAGGSGGGGTVYQLTPSGTETIIYNFTGGADGGSPEGGLIRDGAGNLYGTTISGGNTNCAPSCGVVFKVTPAGQEQVLYRFDTFTGAAPNSGLTLDGKGGAYGTTTQGGANFAGTIYRLGP